VLKIDGRKPIQIEHTSNHSESGTTKWPHRRLHPFYIFVRFVVEEISAEDSPCNYFRISKKYYSLTTVTG
jgi:hypothetical protein